MRPQRYKAVCNFKVKKILTDANKVKTKIFSKHVTVSIKHKHNDDIELKHRISEMKKVLGDNFSQYS